MITETIDREWIRAHAGGKFQAHLNMGDSGQLAYQVVDRRTGAPVGLSYADVSYKRTRRNGDRGGTSERVWFVDGLSGECANLDEALELLDCKREADAHRAAAGVAEPASVFPFSIQLPPRAA